MKLFAKTFLLLLLPVFVNAQTRRQIDSVHLILEHAANDSVRLNACALLGGLYDDVSVDSGLYYCNKGIAIAEKLDLQLNKAEIMAYMTWPLMKTGNYTEALKLISQGMEIVEDASNEKIGAYLQKGQTKEMYRQKVIGFLYSAMESLYTYVGNYEKQIEVSREAITRLEYARDTFNLGGVYTDMGDSYLKLNNPDSALFYQKKALEYDSKLTFDERKFEGDVYTSIGRIYEQMGNFNLARQNYQKAVQLSEQHDNPRHLGLACLQLSKLYIQLEKADSGFLYAKKAIEAFAQGGYKKEIPTAFRMISDYYLDQNNTDSSFAYLRRAMLLSDSIGIIEKRRLQEFQVAAFNQQLQLQQQEKERIEKEGTLKTIAIIALIAVFTTIGLLLYRNNRQKQKANQTLEAKNSQIEQAMNDLKATQKQLIQSEKMASLGELTAGIAHEIQNPLNFVNNFSDVNKELLAELNDEIEKGNLGEVKTIAADIVSNQEKISHHGKRADSIVKGMLQHSRTSSNTKEPTDINALADEYLRLAYHGLRAKDNSFNATMKTDYDESIGKINIIPQDIGRVILNVITNAFYSVNEKSKLQATSYEPRVTVRTRKVNEHIELRVEDNGNGIPKNIVDKIFQPFFTTKPTGQGTGLGLSLSYDIVKAHGGEIKVETREGEGSEFIIYLPA